MVENETYTDKSFNLVECLEMRTRALPMIIVAAIGLGSIGLALNTLGLIAFSNQKSGLLDLQMVVVIVNFFLCSILVLLGTSQYIFLRSCKAHLKQIRLLEQEIFKDVINS